MDKEKAERMARWLEVTMPRYLTDEDSECPEGVRVHLARAAAIIRRSAETTEAVGWRDRAATAVENLAGAMAYQAGLGVGEWEGFIDAAIRFVEESERVRLRLADLTNESAPIVDYLARAATREEDTP